MFKPITLTVFLVLISNFIYPDNTRVNNRDADSLLKIAIKYSVSNNDSAVLLFNKAYSEYQLLNNKQGEMKCLTRLATLFDDNGNMDTALVLSYRAISIGLENNYDTILAETYLRLGNFYKEIKDYETAKGFYYKTIDLKLPTTTNGAWGALGILYSNVEEYDSAKYYLSESYQYFRQLDTTSVSTLFNISSIIGSLGINCFDMGKPAEGLKYFEESLRIARKIGNQPNIVSNLLNLSIAYDMEKQYDKSEEVLKEALDISKSIKNMKLQSRVHLLQSDHYYEIENYKLAYEYLEEYHSIKDSLGFVDYKNSLHKNEMKYLKQIQSIELKKVELEKDRAKLWFIIEFGALGLAFLLITFFLYRKIKIRNREKRKLEQKSISLDSELKGANKRLLAMEQRLEDQSKEIAEKQKQSKYLEDAKLNAAIIELENKKILLTEDWEKYKEVFNILHPHFLNEKIEKHPKLTEGDKRQLIMLKLNYSRKKAAFILGISPDSVKKAQQRLSAKLGLRDITELQAFINQ